MMTCFQKVQGIPALTLFPTPGSSPSTGPAPPPTPPPGRWCPAGDTGQLASGGLALREAPTYGEVFQVDHDGEGHPQRIIGRHHAPSQGDDALRRERGRSSERHELELLQERRRWGGGFLHLGVDVEETVALKVPPLALGIVEQEAVFDDEEPEEWEGDTRGQQ